MDFDFMLSWLHVCTSLVLYSLLCTSMRTTQLQSVYLYVVMVTVHCCVSEKKPLAFSKNELKTNRCFVSVPVLES